MLDCPRSRKGMEMSMQVVVVAVLALIIIAVLIYVFASKTQVFTSSTTCDEDSCTANPTVKPDCSGKGPDYSPGLHVCTYKDSSTKKKYTGRCCEPEVDS